MKARGLLLLLALAGASSLGVACSRTADDGVGSSEGEISPTDRLLVGAPNDYPADPTLRASLPELRSSQVARRKAAWDVARRVLEPVPVDNGTRTLPRFQTWYAKEEILPMFDRILRRQSKADLLAQRSPTPAAIAEAFAWEAERAKSMPDGSEERIAERRAQLDADGNAALGGPERVLMSPALVAHLYGHYDSLLRCIANVPSGSEPPPSDTNFAPCVGEEFPIGTAVVKARWVPDTLPLEAFDTSAEALTTTLGAGEWPLAPRTAAPDERGIYTMRLPSGIRMRLAALHIATKELRDWVWVSLFWSDTPNADYGADRPADFVGPFASYKMCSVVAYDEEDTGDGSPPDDASDASAPVASSPDASAPDAGPRRSPAAFTPPTLASAHAATRAFGPRTWCSNPYLEHGKGASKTNCIGCHQHAGTDATTSSILEGRFAFPDGARAKVRQNFPADYTFVTSTGLELSSLLKSKFDQLTRP